MFFEGLDETKQKELAALRLTAPGKENEMNLLREKIERQQEFLLKLHSEKIDRTHFPNWDSERWLSEIRGFLESLGVFRWGVSPVLRQYAYRNAELDEDERIAIVVVLQMKYSIMKEVPSPEGLVEIFRAYWEAGSVVTRLTEWLRSKGVKATGHHPLGDVNQYHHLLMPPHAYAAGLGEQGRTGLFIDFELGSLVRLGMVTTELDLPTGKPVEKGIRAFCHRCKLCAVNCPVNALPMEGVLDQYFRGVHVDFKVNGDRCIKYFEKKYGCSVCISKCVFAQPNKEKMKKRLERVEQWYNRWILSGDFERLLEKEAQKMDKKIYKPSY